MYDEFPHECEVFYIGEGVEDESGGFAEGGPVTEYVMNCFVDTPSSQEQYNAMQLKNSFDRYLYYPSDYTLLNDRYIRYDGTDYEQVGKPLDQGGQGEIYRVKLREMKL